MGGAGGLLVFRVAGFPLNGGTYCGQNTDYEQYRMGVGRVRSPYTSKLLTIEQRLYYGNGDGKP